MKKILFSVVVAAFFVSMQVNASTYNYVQLETLDLSNTQDFDSTGVESVTLGAVNDVFHYVVQLNIVDSVAGILTISTNNPTVSGLNLEAWSSASLGSDTGDLLDGSSTKVADVYDSLGLSGSQGAGTALGGGFAQLVLGGYAAGTTLFIELSGTVTNVNPIDLDFSVQAVPVPAAVWLFGSALMGLVGISRRKSGSMLSA